MRGRTVPPSLYCFAQKWQKSFTEEPGLRRRRLRVPEEVVTAGMSGSECRQSVGQTDGRVTEGGGAARWGVGLLESQAECAELRSGNHRLSTGGGGCQFEILGGGLDQQSSSLMDESRAAS